MDRDEFLKLVRDLNEYEAKNLLSYLSGYYSETDEFINVALTGIESIKETKEMLDSQ